MAAETTLPIAAATQMAVTPPLLRPQAARLLGALGRTVVLLPRTPYGGRYAVDAAAVTPQAADVTALVDWSVAQAEETEREPAARAEPELCSALKSMAMVLLRLAMA